jgi:hypothetical protein
MYKLKVIKRFGGHYRLEVGTHIQHVTKTAMDMIMYLNSNWRGHKVAWIVVS